MMSMQADNFRRGSGPWETTARLTRPIPNLWRAALTVAVSLATAPLAFAAGPQLANGDGPQWTRGPAKWPDPIRNDVDVSGPFLQRNIAHPHDAQDVDRCGEPYLTQDMVHPDTLVIHCFSSGGLNYQSPAPEAFLTWSYKNPKTSAHPWYQPCYAFVSQDGGRSWSRVAPNPIQSQVITSCADPLAASGPQGQLYLGGDSIHYPVDGKDGPIIPAPPLFGHGSIPKEDLGIGFSRSLDGGRTWSAAIVLPTADDRPFWTVDESNGAIYDLSGCSTFNPKTNRGSFGCTPQSRNLAVSTDGGRTWTPNVNIFQTLPPTTDLTPGRLHNIGGSTIAAAQGVVATVGAVGGSEEGGMAGRALYFKYSTDEGRTFTQRPISISSNGAKCGLPFGGGVAADPAHRGVFAVVVSCSPAATSLSVYVTSDLGATWTSAASLSVVPPPDYRGTPSAFNINRPWIAYGPTGALGVMWVEVYGTAQGGSSPMGTNLKYGPSDTYLALATDGKTFGQPIRLDTTASPSPDPRQWFGDDISNLILDPHYAYAVWNDWRSGELETWFRKVPLSRE